MANIEIDLPRTPIPRTLETSPADYPAALVVFNIGHAAAAYDMFMEEFADRGTQEARNVFADGTLLHVGLEQVVAVELETGDIEVWDKVGQRRTTKLQTVRERGHVSTAFLEEGEQIRLHRPGVFPQTFYEIDDLLTDRVAQFFAYPRAVVGLEYRRATLYDDMTQTLEPATMAAWSRQ